MKERGRERERLCVGGCVCVSPQTSHTIVPPTASIWAHVGLGVMRHSCAPTNERRGCVIRCKPELPSLHPLCSRDRSVSESMSFHFICDTVNKFRMEPRDHESGLCSGNCTPSSGAGGLAWLGLALAPGERSESRPPSCGVTVATGKSASRLLPAVSETGGSKRLF